ncbi:MAG: M12 family metallo-peptidase, partial [Methylomonas sp.]
LSLLALSIYRRRHQLKAHNLFATASATLGGAVLGVLLAFLSMDALYREISELPPPSAGVPPQAGGPMDLLEAPDAAGAAMKPSMPAKVKPARARHARVNFNALKADKLVLNLFDDTTVTAIRDRVVNNMQGGSVWVGHIDDNPDSQVTLAAKGQVLMGTVEWNGRFFEIVYVNGTTHAVRETDPNKIPAQFEPESMSTGKGVTNGAGDATTSSTSSTTVSGGDLTSTGQIIDVLVVYTPKAASNAGGVSGIETKIMNAVTRANQAYLNSQINMQLNLVNMSQTAYTETGDMTVALPRLQGTSDGYMDEVHTLRKQYGADQVVLVDADSNYCGYSYIMTSVSTSFASQAFAVVHDDSVYNCIGSYNSMAHEMGHNQGNVHNPENTSTAGAYADSYGYRVCGVFRDIMSYNCSGEPRIPYFSNPNVLYNGAPTGLVGFNDTARSMNATAPTVANFLSSTTSTTVPNAPTNLVATAMSTSAIALTWADNASNETGYYVQRSQDGGVSWALVATLGYNVTSFSDSGLTAGTAYTYQVYAYNSVGNSAFSNTASATTGVAAIQVVDTTAPAVAISNPVSNAKVATPNQSINISATDNVGVQSLNLYIDGKLVSSSNSSALSYSWNTKKASAGSHTLNAQAKDAAGNTGSTSITVMK